MDFDSSFKILIGEEGGYSNPSAADDPGGETNFGISKRAYPNEDIKGMTLARSKFLYKRDYWDLVGCDSMPDGIRFDLFDTAVNSGVHEAKVLLQTAAGAAADGSIGPASMAAIAAMPIDQLRRRYGGLRLKFMRSLKNWVPNAGGWSTRVADNLLRD